MDIEIIKSTMALENNVLFDDLCAIIDEARRHVATYVNVEACLMNWHVGKRIKEDILYNQRAEYGKQVLKHLSEKLTERYGAGWGTEKLKHCVRSAYLFSEQEITYFFDMLGLPDVFSEKNLENAVLHRTSIKGGSCRQVTASYRYCS